MAILLSFTGGIIMIGIGVIAFPDTTLRSIFIVIGAFMVLGSFVSGMELIVNTIRDNPESKRNDSRKQELKTISSGSSGSLPVLDSPGSFDARLYIYKNCSSSYISGLTPYEDIQKVKNDPDLTSEEKEAVERKLKSLAAMHSMHQ